MSLRRANLGRICVQGLTGIENRLSCYANRSAGTQLFYRLRDDLNGPVGGGTGDAARHGRGPAAAPCGIKKEEARMQAYCLKCRTQREMQNEQRVTMKNGKPATRGKCPVCGTTMYKIGAAK
jgi:hypothetical protein